MEEVNSKRMTWKEIVETYPDKWVGLIDVEWEDPSNVKSAIVKYIDNSSSELLRIQLRDRNFFSIYTTPDNLAPLGIVGG